MRLEFGVRTAGSDPLRSFVGSGLLALSARRGRRHPAGAHAVAVGAALRLHSGARSEVAPLNSLRFASFKQTRRVRGGSALRAPTSALRSSSPHKSPPPDATCRATTECSFRRRQRLVQQRRVRAGWSAPVARREAQGSWPRAQRASSSDPSRLFEQRERSERREFSDVAARPMQRARTQNSPCGLFCAWRAPLRLQAQGHAGKSERSADRSSEARKPARTRLCRTERTECTESRRARRSH